MQRLRVIYRWIIPRVTSGTILYYAIETTCSEARQSMHPPVVYDGKVWCTEPAVEYATAFLYFDELYFYGIV